MVRVIREEKPTADFEKPMADFEKPIADFEKPMADFENQQQLRPQSSHDLAPSPPVDSRPDVSSATAPRSFDPSRMIGIIRRKALIKDLAAVYHGECLSICQELLELQRKWEESYAEIKAQEDTRDGRIKGPKRIKR